MNRSQNAQVIIRHCDNYDPAKIRSIIKSGLEEMGIKPAGKTLVKPNIVTSGPLFQNAHTRPEFIEGVLLALRDRDGGMTELAVGERSGITIPTRTAFDGAGFNPMLKRLKVKRYCFEEEPQVQVNLTHKERLRDYIFTPEPVATADFFVNCPKFKAHPWTTVTFSMKNYIGIQDDRHRLIDHDHRLNEKIADLQYVIQPQFIAIDAIIAGEKSMLTPQPFPMNLIIMGNNQLAFDSVCCQIIGIDPLTVDHLRFAYERGFGPVELDKIKITGDVTLAEAQQRGKTFRKGLIRVEKYFEGTNITAYAGPPPDEEYTDYCWGGCPGAIEEAIEIVRLFDKETDSKMPRIHVVFGAYEGPIHAKPGEKVAFIGDCTKWKGKLAGKEVEIPSIYQGRETKNPLYAKVDDIFVKMAKVTMQMAKNKNQPYVRFKGCPVSIAEQVLLLVGFGKTKNPYLSPAMAVSFLKGYFQWRSNTAVQRTMSNPYHMKGHCTRGKAKPLVTAPKAK